jgi:hypothetical protein
MLQLVAGQRKDGVLDVGEIDAVRTGWISHASEELLCDILGMPEDKLFFSREVATIPEPVERKAWWEFCFADKSTITLVATKRVLPDDFLDIRSQHKKGDKSEATMKALQARKGELVKTLSSSPLEELIVVKAGSVVTDSPEDAR